MSKKQVWAYDDDGSEKKFKCIECGFRSKLPGGIQLHYAKKHGGDQQQPKGCLHENVRLLSKNNQLDKRALDAGYYAHCPDCDDLLREEDF